MTAIPLLSRWRRCRVIHHNKTGSTGLGLRHLDAIHSEMHSIHNFASLQRFVVGYRRNKAVYRPRSRGGRFSPHRQYIVRRGGGPAMTLLSRSVASPLEFPRGTPQFLENRLTVGLSSLCMKIKKNCYTTQP